MFDSHSFILQIFIDCLSYVSTILVSGESEMCHICSHRPYILVGGGGCATKRKCIHAEEKYQRDISSIENSGLVIKWECD